MPTYQTKLVHNGLVVNNKPQLTSDTICRDQSGIYYAAVINDNPDGSGIDSFTKLMLHCNGPDGSTTIIDGSASEHVVTAANSSQIDTLFSKFGGAACDFPSPSSKLTIPDSDDWFFSTNDFTIDFWIRPRSLLTGEDMVLYRQFQDASNFIQFTYESPSIFHLLVVDAASTTIDIDWTGGSPTLTTGTFHHVALVRTGSTFKLAVDGVFVTDKSDVSPLPNLSAPIEISNSVSVNHIDGHIDEYRISNGIARWTTNFTPPSVEYVNPSGLAKDALVYKSTDAILWTGPEIAIQSGGVDLSYPSIVCDGSGILHVFARDTAPVGSGRLIESTRHIDNTVWTSGLVDTLVDASGFYAVAPGSGNKVYCAARSAATDININESTSSGVWATTSTINSPAGALDLNTDNNGNAHLIWNKGDGAPSFKYANSFDGPWTERTLFFSNGILTSGTVPRSTITPDNKIHAVYPSGSASGQVAYFTFDPIASSGSTPSVTPTGIFTPASSPLINNSLEITADNNGRVYVFGFDGTTRAETWIAASGSSTFVEGGFTSDLHDTVSSMGSLSTLWPKFTPIGRTAEVNVNMPETGIFKIFYGESSPSHFFFRDLAGSFPSLSENVTTSISGIVSGLGFTTTQAPDTNSISGLQTGVAKYDRVIIDTEDEINTGVIADLPGSYPLCRRGDGKLFATYTKEESLSLEADLYLSQSSDSGATWSVPEIILDDTSPFSDIFLFPNIVSDGDRTLHSIVYNKPSGTILHQTKPLASGSWSSSTTVASSLGASISGVYAVATSGNGIFALAVGLGFPNNFEVFEFTEGGGWDAGTLVTTPTSGINFSNAAISVDSSGGGHVLWVDSAGDQFRYANSYNGPWASVEVSGVAIPNGLAEARISATIDTNNKIHCAWEDTTTGTPVRYFNFDAIPSGVGLGVAVSNDTIIQSGAFGAQDNLVMITTDLNDQVYITHQTKINGEFVAAVSRSFGTDYSLFFKNVVGNEKTVDGTFTIDATRGSISTLWPQEGNAQLVVHHNIPQSGLYTTMMDAKFNGTTPGTNSVFYDLSTTFEAIPSIQSQVSGYLLGAILVGPVTTQISGLMTPHEEILSQVSGLTTGHNDITSSVSGLMGGVSGLIQSQVSGLMKANPQSQVSGLMTGVSGLIQSQVSGLITPHIVSNSTINGIVVGAVICT